MALNIIRLIKGLFKDSSPQDQPQNTHRFSLNAVIETDEGDNNFISNEESNETWSNIKPGYIVLGKCYMNNNRVALLSVSSDGIISEIGIFYSDSKKYITFVNDAESLDKLNFTVDNQIDVTYRLRRGCEDTIYFTQYGNKPRFFDFSNTADFKNQNGIWVATKFNLQRTYDKIPNYSKAQVLDSGGNLKAGSYNICIQYVDSSLNPTEWITSSPTLKVYKDLSSKEYGEIVGTVTSTEDYLSFQPTNKSIRVDLNNLDENFPYYRLAIVAANSGNGNVNEILYTDIIPISKSFFIFTGLNYTGTGSLEEISAFTDIIGTARHVEQIENRLILGGTEGIPVNYCKLQKFASRIKADCIVKQVTLNDIEDAANAKNPAFEFNDGSGYMPGEIYSYGIVYILEGSILSPVFHIPGKSKEDKDTIFSLTKDSQGKNISFPMGIENSGVSTYVDNNSCGTSNYWGVDCNGVPLANKPVRHHRFPLRSEIGLPLIETTYGDNQSTAYYNLRLHLKGDIKVPVPCPEDNANCGTDKYNVFNVKVDYTLNGEDFSFTETIDPSEYAIGTNANYVLDIYQDSSYHNSTDFKNIVVTVSDVNGTFQNFASWETLDTTEKCGDLSYMNSGQMCMSFTAEVYTSKTQSKIIKSNILGIKFSGIDKPPKDLTNGLEVIGYFIVRNERTEFEKTIIDSGVLTPSVVNDKYISHGLLQPETDKISKEVYGLIHLEHKFRNKEYVIYDKLIQEGNFKVVDRKYGKINYDDVYDGSSYDSKAHKSGNDDGHEADGSPTSRGYDGWSFNLLSRDNIVDFESKSTFTFTASEMEDRFYLDALGHKSINDNKNDVYNVACDNKIGILKLKEGTTIDNANNLPYVVMYKENADSYSNFRLLPYIKATVNPVYFRTDSTTSERTVFGGDTYVSPVRYTNTIYWDNRVADRQGKKSFLKIVLGSLLVITGAVLAFFTGGSSTVLIGTGITLIGAGALFASSGIKMDNYNRAYSEEYEKGLRQTTLDNWVDAFYNYKNNSYTNPGDGTFGFSGNGGSGGSGPSDDTIQWVNECITDLWFESTINTNLRNGFVDDLTPTFLYSPWRVETGNDSSIGTWNFFDRNYTNSNSQRYPVSSLERHGARKLLAFDDKRDDNRYYIGLALGEYYNINPDYERKNTQKTFFHLPSEYNCCSECQEKFPTRVHYSSQSFQEELSDNYRIFLPNNYRDIEGETGKITNLYRFLNNLYIHTEEALWLLPSNIQERVTDQIVSFIGTGEFFAIPPRKIIDDATGNSAGTKHKWGAIKTPAGIVFPSVNQNKFYIFDGKGLEEISNQGISSWFKKNTKSLLNSEYQKNKNEDYPFLDNPANINGIGYLSAYDSRKTRLLFTKKDFKYVDEVFDGDTKICSKGDSLIVFENFTEKVEEQVKLGWNYVGIVNYQLKFEKEITKTRTEKRYVVKNIFKDVDYLVFRYNFNDGRDLDTRTTLLSPIEQPYLGWCQANGIHDDTYIAWGNDNTGTGIESILINLSNIKRDFPDAKEVKFNAKAWWFGARVSGDMNMNAEGYKGGTMSIVNHNFINTGGVLQGSYAFQTINIPNGGQGTCNPDPTNIGDFIYNIEKGELSWDNVSGGEIPQEETWVEEEFEVEYTETVYQYLDGEVKENLKTINNSWTLSYSLKNKSWISWHSYFPNLYITVPEEMFTMINGNNNIWKHNALGKYQNFYGKRFPFIVEFVSLTNPVLTKIWDYFKIITEAKKYNEEYETFVDARYITFNKGIFYNSNQNSGILNFIVKDTQDNSEDYLKQQVENLEGDSIIIDKNEKDWSINQLRDIVVNRDVPMFKSNLESIQEDYYIDKVINADSIDYNKDWFDLESFRDKYLIVRLIFDNFEDVKLLLNYSVEDENISPR